MKSHKLKLSHKLAICGSAITFVAEMLVSTVRGGAYGFNLAPRVFQERFMMKNIIIIIIIINSQLLYQRDRSSDPRFHH